MCGIAGLFRAGNRAVNEGEVRQMVAAMVHRGPDGEGVCVCGPIGLGMRRLAIIDVEGGNQPIWNEDRTMAIVCNGEIYNYQSLRAHLEQKGHRFRTHSDVEVILHLYEDCGDDCFAQLNGMFAVAIAVFGEQKLILARDRFGQKPLYYWNGPEGLAFASELKVLAAMPAFPRDLSRDALAGFLNYRYIPAPLSVFEHARKLRPGSCLVMAENCAQQIRRYWQIQFDSTEHRNGRHGEEEIREQLKQSVNRHLMSERPLGVFLSGGLDSSAIVWCMQELGHRQIHTYTVGFQGYEENEFDNARRVAHQFNTNHHEVTLTADEFWESLSAAAYSLDEPMADLTAIPLYHLSKKARGELVVVLSGEGSDELLAGYPGSEEIRRFFDRLDKWGRLRPLATMLLHWNWPHGLSEKLKTIAGSHADYLARYPTSMGFIFDDEFRRRECASLADCHDTVAPLEEFFASRQDWNGFDLRLAAMIEWWLPDDLLHKADRMTMAHSLELRCPFLDADFARYCASLSLDEKALPSTGEAHRKVALKRAFSELLPEGIAYQTKKGFPIPVYAWLAGPYQKAASAELSRPEALGCSLFSRETRSELMRRAIAGDLISQRRVWSVIVLNKWGDCWL
jgi:asparagine synthase (glutamine-hydrolysing)